MKNSRKSDGNTTGQKAPRLRPKAHSLSIRIWIVSAFCSVALFVAPVQSCLASSQPGAEGSIQLPAISGTYQTNSDHPRVFLTPLQLSDLVERIDIPGSYSGKRFAVLTKQVQQALEANIDWTAAYSGCDLDVYLHAFSYEETNGYASEDRNEQVMERDLGTPAGKSAPKGASIVAARSALYAALLHSGVARPVGGPSEKQATELARSILVAWSTRGFLDEQGRPRLAATQFCDSKGRFDPMQENNVGLQVARGAIYSIHAQDLLQATGSLTEDDERELNEFDKSLYELIRNASNFRASLPEFNKPDFACDRYSNHVGAHLLGLLASARILDDRQRFNAALYGSEGNEKVAIAWTEYFNRAIYGNSDKPIGCHANTGTTPLTSHPYFQTSDVAAGEIVDRYRNASPSQAVGYPMFTLRNLYASARILHNAGFDAFGYAGGHQKSLRLATSYYACLAQSAGFGRQLTDDNAKGCEDFEQYAGNTVSEVETVILPGALHFPGSKSIVDLEPEAKTKSVDASVDPISFGQWRN